MHAWAQNKEPLKGFCNQRKPHAATCCDLPGLPAWTRFQCHCRTTTRKILFNLHFLFLPLRHEKLSKNADEKNLLWVLHSQWFSLIYFYVSLIFIFVYFPAACLSSAFDLNLRNFRTHLEPRLLRQISQNLLSTFAFLTFTLALLFHNRIKRMMSRFWLWLELSNWRHTEAPPSFQSVTQLDA